MRRNFLAWAVPAMAALSIAASGADAPTGTAPSPAPRFVRQWGGYGPNGALFMRPTYLGVNRDGRVYLISSQRSEVQGWSGDGTLAVSWKLGDSGDKREFRVSVFGLVVVGHRVYVAASPREMIGGGVWGFDPDGKFVLSWRARAVEGGFAATPEGDLLVNGGAPSPANSTESWVEGLLRFSPDGRLLDRWPGFPDGPIAVDGKGMVYVAQTVSLAEGRATSILTYSRSGKETARWTFRTPHGGTPCVALAVDSRGNLYAAMWRDGVWKFSPDGQLLGCWQETDSTHEPLGIASGVAVGPDDHVFVSDWVHQRVVEYAA